MLEKYLANAACDKSKTVLLYYCKTVLKTRIKSGKKSWISSNFGTKCSAILEQKYLAGDELGGEVQT